MYNKIFKYYGDHSPHATVAYNRNLSSDNKYSEEELRDIGEGLCELFGRESRTLTGQEVSLLNSMPRMLPEQLQDIHDFYMNSDYEFKRRSLFSLLQHWEQELDKARAYKKEGSK